MRFCRNNSSVFPGDDFSFLARALTNDSEEKNSLREGGYYTHREMYFLQHCKNEQANERFSACRLIGLSLNLAKQ